MVKTSEEPATLFGWVENNSIPVCHRYSKYFFYLGKRALFLSCDKNKLQNDIFFKKECQ